MPPNTYTFSGTGTLTRDIVKTVNLNTNGITEVIITGYTSIGDYAFSPINSAFNYDMPTSFTSVTISASVTTIGLGAFESCGALANVSIPAGVTSIGGYAFSGCNSLTSISIPSSVTSIGDYVFSSCSGLTSISIPSSVTSIGAYAFSGCSGLTSISIPSSVTSIGNSAFYDCGALTTVSIPASVQTIGHFAFYFCVNLTTVSIAVNSQLTSIGNFAFYDCGALTTVYIQDGLLGIQSPGSGYFFGSPSQVTFLLPIITAPSITAPTITDFSISPKIYGDSPFPITPPTSNNTTVGFTYTSDNLSVATITNGTDITITGPGQTMITATQAATPNYLSGTIDTTFTVSQSTQTNPTNIGSAVALEYFLNSTTAKYANIASTLQISTNLQSLMSEKKLFTTQNNVKISHA